MKANLSIILLFLLASNSYAGNINTCISGQEAMDILTNSFIDDGFLDDDVRLIYSELVRSKILEFETPRPYLYATNLSLTKFVKRICHDQICDSGDFEGTIAKCTNPTPWSQPEDCAVLAATKGKNLYCLLTPAGWDPSQPYDPFQEDR